ncbi:MAG: glycosyltransferase family 2 protein [Nonlabens sp.]|uniref:glycosyltransferase family 2 protein n=1 Tax=Nonlabens sp. TaxID=1888209 RepID=UPI00321A6040
MSINCSLVTPTYNWPEALELLLLSVQRQSVLPNEVIIADDGSTSKTLELIQKYQKNFPVPIIHIWHKDNGNQKPAIMNKAIAKARYEYIVEIDGDIILHKDFIKDHLSMAQSNTYLFGSRVNIQKTYLEQLFKNKQIDFNYFSSGIKKRNRTLRLPFLANRAKLETKRSKKLRGCNMSFWKTDFIAVNGFNEELIGWGIDDSELIQRMINNGVLGKRIKHKGIVYHIYHKEQDKSQVHLNLEIEKQMERSGNTYASKGVDQYL